MLRSILLLAAALLGAAAVGAPDARAETLVLGTVGKDVKDELKEFAPLAAYLADRLRPQGIDKVEVQIDDAEWAEAELAEALGEDTWRQWMFPTELDAGFHTIKVRATDSTGELQLEERSEPKPKKRVMKRRLRRRVAELRARKHRLSKRR